MTHEGSNPIKQPSPIQGKGCLPGACPPRGAASCRPQSWDGHGDPSSHLGLDLRPPVNPTGPRGRGHWADRGPSSGLGKVILGYRAPAQPLDTFLLCEANAQISHMGIPQVSLPLPPTPCGVITVCGYPSSNLSSQHQRGREPSSGQTAAQPWGFSAPTCTPHPSHASEGCSVVCGPCLASPRCESWGKARTQPLAYLGALGGAPLWLPPLPFPFINPCCRASHAHSGGPSGRSREICAMHCSHRSDGLRFYLLI